MELKIPSGQWSKFSTASARVGSSVVQLWGDGQPVGNLCDERIRVTHFQNDPEQVRRTLVERILASEDNQKRNVRGMGGCKIRDAGVWDSPEGKLVMLRALMFFCRNYGVDQAHTVDRWANVMEQYDYSCPHSHYESKAALVYFLDLGDESSEHPFSGGFELMDPRIPFCCSRRPDAPTRGILPKVKNGMMICFPSEFLHHVHPYMGERPRITLAFNISAGSEPEGNQEKMKEQVQGGFSSQSTTLGPQVLT